jgi:RNA polymerase sigma-70 factor (ECF subfamily)
VENAVAEPHGELLERLRRRDRTVCEQFVEAHYRGVYRMFLWLTNRPDAAADLTQEAFAAFWGSLSRPAAESAPDPKAWLYGIARNRWRKRCRDARECDGLEEAAAVIDGALGPEASLIRAVDTERIAAAVAALPPDYREALVLRVFDELEYPQIAAALGIAEGLVRWRVHQARQRLRTALETMAKEDTGATCV